MSTEQVVALYLEAMQRLQFEPYMPIYIASGIFQTDPEFANKHFPGKVIWYGRQLLQPGELEHLDLEQLAAIDFLVASKAAKFIGWAGSSFSFWIPQERAIHGMDNSTSYIIQAEDAGDFQGKWMMSGGVMP